MSPEATASAVPTYPGIYETTQQDTRWRRVWHALYAYMRLVGTLVLTRGALKVLDFVGLAYAVHSVTIRWLSLHLQVPSDVHLPPWLLLTISGHAGTVLITAKSLALGWLLFWGLPRALAADWFQYQTARRSVDFAHEHVRCSRRKRHLCPSWLISLKSWIKSRQGWSLFVVVFVLKALPYGSPVHAATVAGAGRAHGWTTFWVLLSGACVKLVIIYGIAHSL